MHITDYPSKYDIINDTKKNDISRNNALHKFKKIR